MSEGNSATPAGPASSGTTSTGGTGTTMGRLLAAREWMSPTLKKSAFLTKGVLTPDEFVKAGDELVFKCPTWTWERGEDKLVRNHLPRDKQYLLTRSVPCTARVSELEQLQVVSETVTGSKGGGGDGENDDDDEWLISQIVKGVAQTSLNQQQQQAVVGQAESMEEDFDILDEEGEVVVPPPPAVVVETPVTPPAAAAAQAEEEEEYADMADLEDDNVLEDSGVVTPAGASGKNNQNEDEDDNDHIVKVRTYDLSITYDKYYQTPRLWMTGYGANGHPLKTEEMMQDVMQDYAHKTVTMERHPHLSHALHASIHPCRHAQVMKTIVSNLVAMNNNSSNNTQSASSASPAAAAKSSPDDPSSSQQPQNQQPPPPPTVESYLFIFLKFVSSIIPTINYDFTVDVTASTVKQRNK